jgi:hypothetical protein
MPNGSLYPFPASIDGASGALTVFLALIEAWGPQ